MKQKITAPVNRAVRVEVYEPRQTPEQAEEILETFELKAGEEREIELPSATAAYRTTRLAVDAVERDTDDKPEIAPAQEAELTTAAQAGIQAGKNRQGEAEKREKAVDSKKKSSKK